MSTISEILTLDLNEDIKNVIDLEDRSENEIQQEIESYIVTEGLSKHLSNKTKTLFYNIKYHPNLYFNAICKKKKKQNIALRL